MLLAHAGAVALTVLASGEVAGGDTAEGAPPMEDEDDEDDEDAADREETS